MKKLGIAFMVLFFSLSGCAYIDQNLSVKPDLSFSSDNIGGGKKIALRVVDDRDDQLIGKRGVQYMPGGKISTDQDLVEVLKNALSDGLRKKGFEPVGENDPSLSMKVELRSLAYTTAMGFWTGGNIGTAVIKIIATEPSGKTYEKTYRSQKEIRTAFVGSQETDAKVVNGALSEAINKIFEDKELLKFLAQ
jgi:uncharacterized lipoprotein YajG